MFLIIVFLIVLFALYVYTNGSFKKDLMSSVKGLIDYFFGGIEEVVELEEEIVDDILGIKKEEVFHIPNQIFTYHEAERFCKEMGYRMATLDDMKKAYLEGAQWPTMGWCQGQLGLYILQPHYIRRHPRSGEIGVNGGYFSNHKVRMGINCYGVKPKPDPARIETSYSDLEDELGIVVDEQGRPIARDSRHSNKHSFSQMMKDGKIVVGPWNDSKWSKDSTEKTRYMMYDVKGTPYVDGDSKHHKDNHKHKHKKDWVKKHSKETFSNPVPDTVKAVNEMSDEEYSQAVASLSRSHIQSILK